VIPSEKTIVGFANDAWKALKILGKVDLSVLATYSK
jgi:hypothetical protein